MNENCRLSFCPRLYCLLASFVSLVLFVVNLPVVDRTCIMRRLVIKLAILVSLTSLATARDIYVDNVAGDDRFDGSRSLTESGTLGPVRTIAKALRLAAPGDRISLAKNDEPYRESVSLTLSRHSASLTQPFVIDGNGATLDGSGPVNRDGWSYEGGDVFCFQPQRLGYQQLFLDAKGRTAIRHPVSPASVTLPPLEPLEWCLWAGKIHFRVESGKTPRDYELGYCTLQTGITLYHVRDVVIEDLTVQGFHVDGVNVSDGVGWTELHGLTCRANGRSGISVGGSSRVVIDGCTLSDNGTAQLRSEGYSHTSVQETRLLDNTAPAIEWRGGEVTIGGQTGVVGEP